MIYASAIRAYRIEWRKLRINWQYAVKIDDGKSHSFSSAHTIALGTAFFLWPEEDGWRGHEATTAEMATQTNVVKTGDDDDLYNSR